ncbi:MAG: S8 family serine peptidase [Flavobacteriales bacterium]|nr:S8 family serine peptidase [Flavobacteriales bacterium]
MKRILLYSFLLFTSITFSQEHAWVYFVDKPNAATFIASPLTMLSQRSIDRRTKQGISLDSKDVPVDLSYINQVENSAGITVKANSKWLNAVHVIGLEADIRALKSSFSFVDSIDFANKNIAFKGQSSSNIKKTSKFETTTTSFNYGLSATQINMLNGQALHDKNYTGAGMYIAILDGGFPRVNVFTPFQRMIDNNQILGGYDFVNRNTNFYTGVSHGTSVLSTMAGFIDGSLVGTAPDASYYLFITEDGPNETPLEESLWVEAAERADSLGVDVINTSLGYSTFDESKYNYTYADMNGSTTFISRGAELAFSRGMILVNAAGNEGTSSWHYISAPADAPSVLSVGAVDASMNPASFTSFGPTSDGRIKPDVSAMGVSSVLINSSGNVSVGNGTSFASPIMAGLVACLWQAYPNATNAQITEAIKNTGSLLASPSDQLGYGIPNFQSAFTTLDVKEIKLQTLGFYPNPVKDIIFINAPQTTSVKVEIMDVLGKRVYQKMRSHLESINISFLSKGMYVMSLSTDNKNKTYKLIKQ